MNTLVSIRDLHKVYFRGNERNVLVTVRRA